MSVMPYALVAPPGELELVAGLRDGSLLAWAEDGSLHRHEPGLPPITSMAVLAG